LLRLPLVYFIIGLLHQRKNGRPTKPLDYLLLPIASLAASFLLTVGLGLLIYAALPSILDLSLLAFLAPLQPAFDVWVNTGWVWFLSFTSVAESLVYPLQFLFLFSSFSMLLWLPTVAGAKAVEKIRRRGHTTFTVPPPYPTYTNELPVTPPKITYRTQTAEQIPETQCEKPLPLQLFRATDPKTAQKAAEQQGLITLWHERERWDLYSRTNCYWAVTPQLALSLLRLDTDMRAENEFDEAERPILRALAVKRWLKKLTTNGKTYYYGLDRETSTLLRKRLTSLAREQSHSEPEIAEK